MTVEQKAEEYFSHHNYALHNRYGVQKDIHRMIYKDGYEQGQKDQNCVNCSNRSSELRKAKIELEQENAELKAQVKKIQNGTLLKELTEKCKEQAEQIEKMKCCSSCKQYKSFLQNECTYDYLHSEECKKNHFSKWELAKGN